MFTPEEISRFQRRQEEGYERTTRASASSGTPTDVPMDGEGEAVSSGEGASTSSDQTTHASVSAATPTDVPMDVQCEGGAVSSGEGVATNATQGDETDCAYCYGVYDPADGQDWVQCACEQWVHEECIEEIFLDARRRERFCPFCLNTRMA